MKVCPKCIFWCEQNHKKPRGVVYIHDLNKFQRGMTKVKINGKILSEMTFQEAYPEVIRLLIEGRFPTIK